MCVNGGGVVFVFVVGICLRQVVCFVSPYVFSVYTFYMVANLCRTGTGNEWLTAHRMPDCSLIMSYFFLIPSQMFQKTKIMCFQNLHFDIAAFNLQTWLMHVEFETDD